MKDLEVGKRLSMDGGKHIGRKTQYNVAHAIRIVGTRDRDGDGVIDMYDCQPLNPNADGFWGDVGHAAKERVSSELEDIKERTVSRIKGEDVYGGTTIQKRTILRGVEQEEELKESIQQAKARGKQTARKKYRVAPITKKKKKKATSRSAIEYHDTIYSPVTKKKATTKRLRSKVAPKRLRSKVAPKRKASPYPSCV